IDILSGALDVTGDFTATSNSDGARIEFGLLDLSGTNTFNQSGFITAIGSTLELTGSSSGSGDLGVTSGVLELDGSLTGSHITDSGTVQGIGTSSAPILVEGGFSFITAGTPSNTGILRTGDLSLVEGGALEAQLNGAAAGTGY